MAMKLMKSPALPLLLILASSAAWITLHDRAAAPNSSPTTPNEIFFVSPLEETAADTVPEWANRAEVVVKANITGEHEIAPPKSETADQDGFDLFGRVVSLEVSEVIWRSPDATHPNPTRFNLDAWGWMRADDGSGREVASEGAARLEPGHAYVLALHWREAECAPGDETVPAHWSLLGSGAALPADDDTIGVGEFQGSELDLVNNPAAVPIPPDTVLAEFAGQGSTAMEAALDQASDDSSDAIAENPASCTR